MEASTVHRVLERCDILAEISDEPGRLTRWFLSPAMERVNEEVAAWMRAAGLGTERDAFGNLIATRSCGLDGAPLLVLGSHLDTVRDAGRYDGILGVLLALAVVEELQGVVLPFDLEIVAFADEEGLRFDLPFLGSRALVGDLGADELARRDAVGIRVAEAVRDWGGDPTVRSSRYAGRRVVGFIEAHIEQGPVLEDRGAPLGVLEAIAGACWSRARFRGRAGHAGTTPMELRRDALAGAAELVLAAEGLARDTPGLVATVGKLSPEPGAGNVIPGAAELSLDVRHPDDRRLDEAMTRLLAEAGEIARRRGLELEHEVLCRQPAVTADAELSDRLAAAVAARGLEPHRLVIGAGHDAMILARSMPMTMLFLRSPGGLSHHPDESVVPADVHAAAAALQALVEDLASRSAAELPRNDP